MHGTFAIAKENGTLAVPMLTVPAGSGFRLGLVALLAIVTGCAANPSTGSIEVLVNLEPGLISRCVKVTARDGVNATETKPIPLLGKMSPLKIGMTEDGLVSPVTLQAFGYTDVGCTILSAGEKSATVEASYATPTAVVTLTLAPAANGDGGRDGGADGGTDAGRDAGTDAGVDAGIDVDLDGYPVPADCNDADPNIHPNALESCADGIDNNCNNQIDCADLVCDGFACPNNGTCNGTTCMASMEICSDGVDNNTNGLIDCADPDCVIGMMCTDSNACTTGDRCVSDGGCQKTGDIACTSPPAAQCYSATGMCLADAGATCFYAPTTGSCNDNLGCTLNDTCDGDGGCTGTAKTCTQASNSCVASTGSCAEPSGTCTFAALPSNTGTCSDGNNCTTGDTCDGDGGCTGSVVSCIPNQCQTASTGCTAPGACIFGNKNGQACDAGTGGPATCDTSFNCNATPTSLFPYTPTNFTEAQLPRDGGIAWNVSSSRTLNTDTPSVTVGTMPPFTLITPGGVPTLLIQVSGFTVSGGQTLTVTGAKPVIIAVVGDSTIDGRILLRNGDAAACGAGGNGTDVGSGNGFAGGGGGGFGTVGGIGGASGGTAGAAGAINGNPELAPLRGGCPGGDGTSNGGNGGGALQLSVTGTLTVNNIITAPGRGGTGASNTTGNSGGGGGSGGAILLEANAVSLTANARLTANGGGGGEGSGQNNTGGNGSDGSENSNTPANGGSGSTNGGNGGPGGTSSAAAGAGLGGNGNNDGSGGGGGAVGRIRINGSCSRTGSGQVISPNATPSNCP